MDRNDEQRAAPAGAADLEPSHLWVLGLAIDERNALAGPGHRQFSDWAECNCPDDCLRDHANE